MHAGKQRPLSTHAAYAYCFKHAKAILCDAGAQELSRKGRIREWRQIGERVDACVGLVLAEEPAFGRSQDRGVDPIAVDLNQALLSAIGLRCASVVIPGRRTGNDQSQCESGECIEFLSSLFKGSFP
jgi:hypothetical protein